MTPDGYVINIAFVVFYLLVLIAIGFYGRLQKKDNSLSDFYLGGRDFGFILLFLTFYASQYSGNTIIGFSGKAYREGFLTLVIVVFMVAIIAGILSYAPKLYHLSRSKNYITLADYIIDRYQHKLLHYLVILICIFVLSNYILSNLKAVGYIIYTLSNGEISIAWGIVILAIVIFIYETLGGIRSVVFTDAIQGILLLITIQIIFFVVVYSYGFSTDNIQYITHNTQQQPDIADKIKWLSTIFLVFFSISVYPHVIQRVFMARNEAALRKSFKFMAIMPFFTTLPIILIAIIATNVIPGLDDTASENIIILMLNKLAHIKILNIAVLLFFTAVIAAIMSTIDSSNMAMHSMLIKNVYLKIKPHSNQNNVIAVSKLFSLLLLALLSYLAINIDASIWAIIKIKLEVLAQLFPMIVLGVWYKQISAKPILYGLLVGLAVVIYLILFATSPNPLNIHAGLWGIIANFATIGITMQFKSSANIKNI